MGKQRDIEAWANCTHLPGCKPEKPGIYTYITDTEALQASRLIQETELSYEIKYENLRALPRLIVIKDLGMFHNPYPNNINRTRWLLVQCPYCGVQYDLRASNISQAQSCQLCKHTVRRLKSVMLGRLRKDKQPERPGNDN